GTAIFLIFAILLAQFNKLTSVFVVLTAVVMSTFGVLLGLLIMGQAFGVVMTGIGVIANAGVIVNNNIVLIDTYDRLRREGVAAYDAIIQTCRERARPVVLTAVTAILGVLPIAFGINVEFVAREVVIGAPATQWWIHLSTAIVFGLGFATVLTLIVTPAILMTIENMRQWRVGWGGRSWGWVAGSGRARGGWMTEVHDRGVVLHGGKRNQVLTLAEVEQYGLDSFADPDYVRIYGMTPKEWYGRGIRLLGRTAVECTRDTLADRIGRD